MINKIFSNLKTEYAQLGLGDDFLKQIAESIFATGIVTDDNLDAVIKAQKTMLLAFQKNNDKRVTEAIKKATDEKQKTDEANKALQTELEELKKELTNKDKIPPSSNDDTFDEIKKQYDQKFAESATALDTLRQQIETLVKANKEQGDKLTVMQTENNAMKAEKARMEREAFISNTAKELGIPEWRTKEGFAIAPEADNDTIKNYLSSVANNIKTAVIPQGLNGRLAPLNGNTATKAEVEAVVGSILS